MKKTICTGLILVVAIGIMAQIIDTTELDLS